MIRAFVLEWLGLSTEVKSVESTNHYHEVIRVITKSCRNGKTSRIDCVVAYTLRRSWLGIFRRVSVVSQKLIVMVVGCKKEDHGETVVDDR